jgi:hypothetical protein
MKFQAGKYYVGDLCYVLNDRWDEFCSLTISGRHVLDGTFALKDGTTFWTHCTMYGDGSYRDQQGRDYGVDAGLIGVISIEDMDREPFCVSGGQVIEFKHAFEPYYQNGTFYIGNVVIKTGDDAYSHYEDEDGWGNDD